MYSIKAVSQATGLTVETLRAWERRYGIVAPNRDPTGRRVYRADDVLRLRRLREATERGHPIGRLAELSEESLAQLLNEAPDRRTRATSSAFVERILEAAKEYRSAECEQALTLAIAMMPPQRLVSDVLQPLLREVGERWHRGEFAISQERLVSTIVRRHVGLMLDTYDRTARHQAIVFATLPGERHELGLLMSAMICASRGFKTHYLGPDLPEAEIARYAREVGASIIALSVVLHEQLARLPQQLESLAGAMAPGSVIWLGGLPPDALPRDSIPEGCVMLRSYAELEQRLDMLAA
ncbi:MAG: MerR family transcriptional regulator [Pseudomonadota bacterium]|jgi:DNA-binding transcriptional MerR regulator|nr:MerR family transcriptional regulator [Pseudomonadota bacterium]MDQ1310055.1 MerR family transcriptional regulator [Pseudomonadota bacterium]MDQ1341613.1 MerR family transcriptional regulator [Pseudomonadota bacterium]